MGMRTVFASLLCKSTYHALRLTGRGATSLPGKLALRVDDGFLPTLARDVRTIVVTGTNGKTTTSHIIHQALDNAGLGAFYNRSGANLIQGITTEFSMRSTLSGKPRERLAVIECDEGALRHVCAALDPVVVVVTNVFRDQLDRYGEVMHTRDNILAGLRNAPHALLCLNADDPMVASMAGEVENETLFFGVNCEIYPERVEDLSDARRCVECGAEYGYSYRTYGHLGGYVCAACGFSRPEPNIAVEQILERGADSCVLQMSFGGVNEQVRADVPAGYDIYNCCATAAGLAAFGFDRSEIAAALSKFKHGFGRSEVFSIGSARVRLMLMKNPAGCNQIINLLLNSTSGGGGLVCILNDQECDGTDVSWIYDAAWEALCGRVGKVLCSGSRAQDMAVRLKYAGLHLDAGCLETDYASLFDRIGLMQGDVTVMANYSGMLEFRAVAARRLGLAGFWEG